MNIFKEYTENQKRAKDKIKREKEADKLKHDRMMDQARTRDTRRKNTMSESEIHVRLDHLDGDSRQKKAGAVMRKHERAGHIEYRGNTDKGVVFKAKSKSHADRLHRELKPHATGVEHMSEAKSAQDPDIKDREGTQPAAYHKGLKKTTKAKRDAHFKKHGKKADDDASAYKDAPGDKKARKGDMPKSKYTKFVDNMMKEGTDFAAHRAKPKLTDSDRKKMAKVADMMRKEREKKAAMKEAMGDAEHKAAVKHITDLGKKNNMTVGQQRMHIDNHPGKHDEKTRQAAKTINKNQFGNWKKGKDGKMTQEGVEQVNEVDKGFGQRMKAADAAAAIYSPTKRKPDNREIDKIRAKYRGQKKTQEETQIDELSKKTMGSYVKKASQSAADHGMQAGKKQAERDEVDRSTNRHGNVDKDAVHKAFGTTHSDVRKPELKAAKRLRGINRAVSKLTKEDIDYMKSNQHPLDRSDAHHTQASFHSQEAAKAKKAGDNVAHGQHKNAARHHTAAGDAWERHHAKVKKGMNVSPPHQMSKVAHSSTQNAAGMNEGAYKGKDAFGRGVTAALRGGKAGAYIAKKAKERSDMNKKNDPGSAKKGYALSVTDKDKAMKKARKKGLSPKHPSTNYNRKLPEEKQKKDHQTISYVTHGNQKGKVQVHKDNAFKALNHYRKNNKSAQFEAMSPESRKAHGRMFKAAAKKKYDADTKAAAQAEREKRLKAKGWVKNDRGGMSKVSEEADKSLAAKAAKSGISVGTLKKVYNRGVAAWKTGHRPGTTPSQWGHARVNAFIAKKKKGGLNHDKDLA